jgi:4a-hydroxytetrahydrobiopterin dehydratase
MTPEEVEENAKSLDGGWEVSDGKKIKRTFTFDNFKDAVSFVDGVAKIAEAEGHHPEIRIYSYKNVDITLSTHSTGSISEKDFALAVKIDGMIEQ